MCIILQLFILTNILLLSIHLCYTFNIVFISKHSPLKQVITLLQLCYIQEKCIQHNPMEQYFDKLRLQLFHTNNQMLNKNMTSLSFTVSDDLLSVDGNLNSTQKTAFHGLKPFGKQYGLNFKSFDQQPLPNRQNRQAMERAKMDAYQQMNENLYNPFDHKLGNCYIRKQSELYHQEKQKQIQLLKKKQQQLWQNQNNYTIVFHNEKKSNHTLQMAGKNILSDSDVPTIADYYKNKFPHKQMEHIQQQNQQHLLENNKKINNFVNSSKKYDKNKSELINNKPNPQTNYKKQSIKQKKNQNQPISLKHMNNILPTSKPVSNKQLNSSPKNLNSNQIRQSKTNKPIPTPKSSKRPSSIGKKQNDIIKKQNQLSQIKSSIHSSTKSSEQCKKQPPPTKKPQFPRIPNKPQKQPNKKKLYSQVYEGCDRNLVQQLQRQLTQCPTITFDEIAELQTAKNLLQQAVLLPRLMPQFFQGIRKAMKGILLFGPPGTGKTLLAKAIAKDNIFFNVSASSLASKWKGDSQKMVRILFQMAKYHSPSIIFFDEIDCIGTKRSQNEHESSRKLKTQLLIQMDGVGSNDNEVFVLAATNRPWDLDQALRRRLEKRICIADHILDIPLPGTEGRKKMFQINLKGVKVSDKINWDKLVELTNGCSGADICNICRDAAYMPMRRKLTQIGGIGKLQQLKQHQLINEQLLQADLIDACKKVKPSVGKNDLKKYQNWMNEFGST